MSVITISGEYGTESEAVAARAAHALGYEFIGHNLLSEISKQLNLSEGQAEMYRRTSQSRLLRFVDRYTCTLVQKIIDPGIGCLDDKAYFETAKKLVEDLYAAGDMILVGWGGQCILRGRPQTLHVRLIKDLDRKIAHAAQVHNLQTDAARKHVERYERNLADYIAHYFEADWNDVRLYDVIINMGETTVDAAAATIRANLKDSAAVG
jgi:cytidylate kinase